MAHGLHPVEMNLLTELWLGLPAPAYTRTRGWSGADAAAALSGLRSRGLVSRGQLTWEGESLRTAIETSTNLCERGIVDGIGAELDGVVQTLESWSQRCIETASFTADRGKRMAG